MLLSLKMGASAAIRFAYTFGPKCTQSVYPFHDGAYQDFAPIFEELIKVRRPF